MSYHFPDLPVPADQIRVDGWSPSRQRRFLEVLAATGVIRTACEAVYITPRSAYTLRIRRDGAAFRLGWDAAILIARTRLADTLLARAILGSEDRIRKDPDSHDITRHRHDNRLAMSMLARLDRMADCPAEGSDAALARVVAQDFVAYLDLICPEEEAHGLMTAADPSPADDARMLDGSMPDVPEPAAEATAAALSPGASAALFIAARTALLSSTAATKIPYFSATHERCELRPEPPVDLMSLPPEQAAARLRGIWYDEDRDGLRTDFPAPPGFEGDENDSLYDMDCYERDLTEEEEDAYDARLAEERRPYEEAAARARDAFFSLTDIAPSHMTG